MSKLRDFSQSKSIYVRKNAVAPGELLNDDFHKVLTLKI